MIEVTDEMVNKAMRAYQAAPYTGAGSWPGLRAALSAVAPLIEAQARAEIERLVKSRNKWGKLYNETLEKLRLAVMSDSEECKVLTEQNAALRAALAQARAAAIEEAEIAREALGPFAEAYSNALRHAHPNLPLDDIHKQAALVSMINDVAFVDFKRVAVAEMKLRALSRPVSEREGADTAPAPAVSGGMVSVPREVVEFLCGAAPLDGVWFSERHPSETGAFWWRRRLRALAAADRSAAPTGLTQEDPA